MSTRFAAAAVLLTGCSLDVLPSESDVSRQVTLPSELELTETGAGPDAAWVGGTDGQGGPALFRVTDFQTIQQVPVPSGFSGPVTAISDDARWIGGMDRVAAPGGARPSTIPIPDCGAVQDLAGSESDLWVVCAEEVVCISNATVIERRSIPGLEAVAVDGPTVLGVGRGVFRLGEGLDDAEVRPMFGTESLELVDVATWTLDRWIAVGSSTTGDPVAVVIHRTRDRVERLPIDLRARAAAVDAAGSVYGAGGETVLLLFPPEPTPLRPLLPTELSDMSAGDGFVTLVGRRIDEPGSTLTRISLPLRFEAADTEARP